MDHGDHGKRKKARAIGCGAKGVLLVTSGGGVTQIHGIRHSDSVHLLDPMGIYKYTYMMVTDHGEGP